jgi:hypothetical protein
MRRSSGVRGPARRHASGPGTGLMPWLWLACLAAVIAFAGNAHAQITRNLPANGAIGVLTADSSLPLPLVRIDSKVFRMSPGGIIVDQHNRTLLHGQIPPRAAAYIQFDKNGEILRMFLLTPAELQRLQAR